MSTVSLMTSLLKEDCSGFFAAATQNARSPTVWRRVCDTAISADDAEQRCRPGRSATWRRLSLRYVVARPLRHRNASTASLKDISCVTRSQCSQWKRGMIWSYRLALNTNRAAAFITDCNRRSWCNGRPANVAFPKSSFDNTRATTMDGKTERVSERRILLSRLSMKKQFNTVRATWEHMLTSESK